MAVHCHDDLGMGTANAVTALDVGAAWADVSLLGLGERAGLAATEEVAAWLAMRRGRPYRLEVLRDLCALAARAAGMELPGHKAVAGADLFTCESGLHAHGLARDPSLFEPFDPSLVGGSEADRRLAVGKKSGRAAVDMAAARPGPGTGRAVHGARGPAALGRPEPPPDRRGTAGLGRRPALWPRRVPRPADPLGARAAFPRLPGGRLRGYDAQDRTSSHGDPMPPAISRRVAPALNGPHGPHDPHDPHRPGGRAPAPRPALVPRPRGRAISRSRGAWTRACPTS